MRCLSCHKDGIAKNETSCPECGAYFPQLLRDMLPAGTLLCNDTYRIHSALDQGGFGIVYQAVHTALDSIVAIKEFYPRAYAQRGSNGIVQIPPKYHEIFAMERRQFLREGQILADLNLHGIINVLNLFEAHNTTYLVMEMLQGQPLRQELNQREKLPPEQVRKIIRQLVITLEALHRRGVYHLDIKPENVFFTKKGRIILVDFGAARLGKNDTIVPQFDPAYAPPELLNKGGEVGPQSDLFELGMLAYELLTGARPVPVQERIYGKKDWDIARLEDPLWKKSLLPTLHLEKTKRPASVLNWWLQTIGAGLPRVFIDDPKILLDPEEAQARLEERLAHFHGEYNKMHDNLSRQKSLARKQEQEIKELKEGRPPTDEQAGQWQTELQEEQKQNNDLKQALRAADTQVLTLRDTLKKKEQENVALQEGQRQSKDLKQALGAANTQVAALKDTLKKKEQENVALQEEQRQKYKLQQTLHTTEQQNITLRDTLKQKEREISEIQQGKRYSEDQTRGWYNSFLGEQRERARLGQALEAANKQAMAYKEAGQRQYEELQARSYHIQNLSRELDLSRKFASPQRNVALYDESIGTICSILFRKIGKALEQLWRSIRPS